MSYLLAIKALCCSDKHSLQRRRKIPYFEGITFRDRAVGASRCLSFDGTNEGLARAVVMGSAVGCPTA